METDFRQIIDFRYHLHEDIYVVWIASVNRYLQLKEPAFFVFSKWAEGLNQPDIIVSCKSRYHLSMSESRRFVHEIIDQVQLLINAKPEGIQKDTCESAVTESENYTATYNYQIGSGVFRFIYHNRYMEDLFHPMFRHYATESDSKDFKCIFKIITRDAKDILYINEQMLCELPVEAIDLFQGAVFMEILNALHGKQMSDWMGVLHASAVTDGKKAVIFTAPSGSGKSTIAMLMMAQGYASLSDDFVPVAIQEPEVYHFPAGISVKPGAAALLKEQLPQLQPIKANPIPGEEIYVAPASSNIHPSVPACAIVFVKYDSEVAYDLTREPNLGMMNDLIRQSWIAGTPEAAERFLHWYLNLPVYSLRYSDNTSAVKGLSKLFG